MKGQDFLLFSLKFGLLRLVLPPWWRQLWDCFGFILFFFVPGSPRPVALLQTWSLWNPSFLRAGLLLLPMLLLGVFHLGGGSCQFNCFLVPVWVQSLFLTLDPFLSVPLNSPFCCPSLLEFGFLFQGPCLHSEAFLCSFLGKTSALRFFMHLLENILMIDNMLSRVSKKCHIFF